MTGLQTLIGNSSILGLLSGEDKGQSAPASHPPCPHDHGPSRPRPELHGEEHEPGKGEKFGGIIGRALGNVGGGIVGGTVGGFLGSGLGALVDDGLETLNQFTNETPDTAGTVLGEDVDKIIEASPTLADALAKARANGWTIEMGPAGDGTFADPNTEVITIDSAGAQDPAELANSLAHELGHANDTIEYISMENVGREEYIRENTYADLRGEAEATISELMVRDELLASDLGLDTGVSGATSETKKLLWAEYKAGSMTREELVGEISELFATGEITSDSNLPYYDHYAQYHAECWDNAHP